MHGDHFTALLKMSGELEQKVMSNDREAISQAVDMAFSLLEQKGETELSKALKQKISEGDKKAEKEVALMGARAFKGISDEAWQVHKQNMEIQAAVAVHVMEVDGLEEATKQAMATLRNLEKLSEELRQNKSSE